MLAKLAREDYLKAMVKALANPTKDRLSTGELAKLARISHREISS